MSNLYLTLVNWRTTTTCAEKDGVHRMFAEKYGRRPENIRIMCNPDGWVLDDKTVTVVVCDISTQSVVAFQFVRCDI
jgi:hypothetical protein